LNTTVNEYTAIMFTMENFGDWLLEQLKEKNISQSELSRLAGLSKGTISNLINGTKGKGPDSLTAIAHALKLPVDLVFEKAKMLPPKPDLSPIKRKLIHVAESEELADSDVELAITLLEQRIELYKKHPKARPAE
jgi:transcriptional regulator with XRE-family HTH domain